MSIKIKLNDDGSVDPEVMRLLRVLAQHRDGCRQCGDAYAMRTEKFCETGWKLLAELGQQPSVSDGADLQKKINESN